MRPIQVITTHGYGVADENLTVSYSNASLLGLKISNYELYPRKSLRQRYVKRRKSVVRPIQVITTHGYGVADENITVFHSNASLLAIKNLKL